MVKDWLRRVLTLHLRYNLKQVNYKRMKNSILKVALLLLCGVLALSSCSNDDPIEKKTVTVKYRILVNSDIDYISFQNGGGIIDGINLQKLY